jgi:hypothetical protein
VKNKYSLPRVDLEAHLETIRSYLNEYKTLPAAQQKVISRIFTTFITTSCWPKMHRRVYSWSSLSLIKQLCAIDRDTLQSLSSKLETPYVLPDVSLFKFLQTGWNSYLPRLLDHHPDVKSSSTGTAPLPQKLLDAITSKGSYLYSRDVAIDFHNLLTSSLITYVVRLDYVDRALRKLNGKIPTDPHPLELLFDGLSIAIRAVCAISHSKAMAAHMNLLSGYVRLPKDQDASDSLSFISDLIENNSMQSLEAQGVAQYLKSRGEGRKHSDQSNGQDGNSDGPSSRDGVTDDGQNSKEDNSNDCWEDDFEDDGLPTELTGTPFTPNKNDSEGSVTPEPVIIRRWIMSLVDHFASILVLERACVKLPDSGEISFSLLGVDHRRRNLPDWKKVETITRQLMLAVPTKKTDTFITQLKAYIKNYRSDGCIPGTEARLRDSAILPFQGLLKHDLDPQSQTESVTACLHCEATLMALMSYLAANSKHDLARLLQACSHLLLIMIIS